MNARIQAKPGKADAVKNQATSTATKEELSDMLNEETKAVVAEIKINEVPQTTVTPIVNSSTEAPQAEGDATNTTTTTSQSVPATVSTTISEANSSTRAPHIPDPKEWKTYKGNNKRTTTKPSSSKKPAYASAKSTRKGAIPLDETSNNYAGIDRSIAFLIGLVALFIMN